MKGQTLAEKVAWQRRTRELLATARRIRLAIFDYEDNGRDAAAKAQRVLDKIAARVTAIKEGR